jgi:hypothetical protein
VLASFWQQQPSHTLFNAKAFNADLTIDGRETISGDMIFYLHLADDSQGFQELCRRSRRSRRPSSGSVFLNDRIVRETAEPIPHRHDTDAAITLKRQWF